MILIRDIPAAYYIARTGENGLPVIEKEIKNVPYLNDAKELTLTEKEYYLFASLYSILHFTSGQLNRAKKPAMTSIRRLIQY